MLFHQSIKSIDTDIQICEGIVEVCLIDIETKTPQPLPNDLLLIFDSGEVNE